jgi:hypothetical protein
MILWRDTNTVANRANKQGLLTPSQQGSTVEVEGKLMILIYLGVLMRAEFRR